MNAFIIEDRDGEVRVELKVDALNENFGRFQVYEVVGQSEAIMRAGIQFRALDYGKTDDLIAIANRYDLKVSFVNSRLGTTTTIRDFDDFSYSISLTDSLL